MHRIAGRLAEVCMACGILSLNGRGRRCQPVWYRNKGIEGMNGSRKRTRNEKIFYVISLLIVLSMIVSLIAVAITPQGF